MFGPVSFIRVVGWFLLMVVLAWGIGSRVATVWAAPESFTQVTGVRLVPFQQEGADQKDGWALSAEFRVKLSYKLEEAARKGLPLKFFVDFRLLEPRWYWFDNTVVSSRFPIVLSYYALTRNFRVQTPDTTKTFASLPEAVQSMTRLSDWYLIPRELIRGGQQYKAQVRFALDLSEMPKPFQINAFTNRQWLLGSDWLAFDFTPKPEVFQ